ncbi:MAG TPA: hypothetical protein VJB63_03000 [Patescibacteria group bacterium]|nr:hypothetical protein [Patescibacteria group bacterium]
MLTSDIKQNLIITLYLSFTHNYILFAYLTGLFISIVVAIKQPSRFITLILIGFAVLAFSYEYDKHIIVSFRNQTITSLITETPHYRLQKYINLAISEAIPILLYLTGWIFIYSGLVTVGLQKRKKES